MPKFDEKSTEVIYGNDFYVNTKYRIFQMRKYDQMDDYKFRGREQTVFVVVCDVK